MIPKKDWMDEIAYFWEAFYKVFVLETSNPTCGSHVHVKPSGPGYGMETLKKIAYAVIIYEKHVLEILPSERRTHDYCRPNTQVSPELVRLFENGRSKYSYEKVRQEIRKIDTFPRLCTFMQGNEDGGRRVLWNFRNLLPSKSGTIEFRGISGVHSAQETIIWILFAVGFILLVSKEVCDLMNCFDLGPNALLTRARRTSSVVGRVSLM